MNLNVRIVSIAILLNLLLIFAHAQDKESSFVQEAWTKVANNKISEAMLSFKDAIATKKELKRAYLGLSYLYQMQGKNELSWENYEKALYLCSDKNPYIFASTMTGRAMLSSNPEKDKGIYRFIPLLLAKSDSSGVLKASLLEKIGRFEEEYGSNKKAIKYFNQLNAVVDWAVIGPFENISASGFRKVFPPEKEYEPSKEYVGKDEIPTKWFNPVAIRNDKWIDFLRYFANRESIYYGNTFVFSPIKQQVQIRVGTSGSLKCFLNNTEILSYSDENNNDLDTYIAETELQAGWNRLLIKCGVSEINQCNFLVRVTNSNGDAIDNLKYSIQKQEYSVNENLPVKTIKNFAEKYFEKQIALQPSYIENYLLLAETYLRNDKAPEAEKVLREALSKMPNSVLILNHLIEAFIRGEKRDEINSTTEKIYSHYPYIPTILQKKFYEYWKNEDIEKCEKILSLINEVEPNSPSQRRMTIQILFKKNDQENALKLLEETFKEFPKNWEYTQIWTNLLIESTKSYTQSIYIIKKFIKNRRINAAYTNLAAIYLKNSDLRNYEKTMLKIVKQDPSATGVYYSMAKEFFKMKNYSKTIFYVNKCLELCQNYSVYWALLGQSYQRQSKNVEAIKHYKTAIKYNSQNFEVIDRIRELNGKSSIFNNFASENIKTLVKNSPGANSYSNSDALILLEDYKRVVYESGVSENRKEVLVKVFNNDGINSFKEYQIPYNSYNENLIIEKAAIYKSDGTEIKADIDKNYVVFKSLEPNDCLYIKWKKRNYYSGKLGRHIWEATNFNYFYPIKTIRYSILVPDSFKFRYKTQNMSIEPNIKKTEDGKIYTWKLSDQAKIKGEYSMPVLNDIGKMLFISSIPNWEFLVDWYLDLAKEKTKINFEIKDKVALLLKGKENAPQLEKLRIIYNYICENINYSSVSFRQSGLVPQKARTVLSQKIGDCKDMATLCIAMLKEAGISSHYVLVNTFYEGQNKNILPALEFNHAIAAAEIEDSVIYMDLTARGYPLFTVPKGDLDAFALEIVPGTKAPFYLENKKFIKGEIKRKSTVKIKENGTAEIIRESFKSGIPAAEMRNSYRYLGKSDKLKKITEVLADSYANVKVDSFSINNMDNNAPTVHYFYSFKVPNFLKDAGGMKLLSIPWCDKIDNFRALSYEKREHDILYRVSSSLNEENIEIKLPKGYFPLKLKNKIEYKSEMEEYSITLKYKNGKIFAKRIRKVKKMILPKNKYDSFKKYYNNALQADAQTIILQKK